MNKQLLPEEKERMQRCIKDMNNTTNCSDVTGMHSLTINSIIERGYGKQSQIVKLLEYCDIVEGITTTD